MGHNHNLGKTCEQFYCWKKISLDVYSGGVIPLCVKGRLSFLGHFSSKFGLEEV